MYPLSSVAAVAPLPLAHRVGPPVHEEPAGTPPTPAPRGHHDSMHRARSGEQATGSPLAALADGARRGENSADDGKGLVRSAAGSAARSSDEDGCLCPLLLTAGRDVFRGYGAGKKDQYFEGRGGSNRAVSTLFDDRKHVEGLMKGRIGF